MAYKYLIDLNNEADWLYPIVIQNPDGTVGEYQRTICLPEGEHRVFAVTDSVMCKTQDGKLHYHEHHEGYELFFVDSGGMDIIMNGKRGRIDPGNILFIQPYEAHGMYFHEDTKYRGFFHDLKNLDNAEAAALLRGANPDYAKDPSFRMEMMMPGDHYDREEPEYVVVPPEEHPNIRSIRRPMAEFELAGASLKMITARWENGGVCENWAAELPAGFCAESVPFPGEGALYYVTAGEIRFRVLGEEFTARPECIVKIPELAAYTLEAVTDAVIYDVGGLPRWYAYLQDRSSILHYAPERAEDPAVFEELRKKYGIQIASVCRK